LIVENLSLLLKTVADHTSGQICPKPLYIGQRRSAMGNTSYFVGGGYTISAAALSKMVHHMLPSCYPHEQRNTEDAFVGKCFGRMNVFGYDARDALGEERYHSFDPQFVYDFRPGIGTEPIDVFWTSERGNMPPKYGLEAMSNYSVSFRMIRTPAKMRRMYKLLYRKDDDDCGSPGAEPGMVATQEMIEAVPHKDCHWDTSKGSYQECQEYDDHVLNKEPPAGLYNTIVYVDENGLEVDIEGDVVQGGVDYGFEGEVMEGEVVEGEIMEGKVVKGDVTEVEIVEGEAMEGEVR